MAKPPPPTAAKARPHSPIDHSAPHPHITYKEIYRRIFRVIFYRIWLHRKLHYLITILQLMMPPVILYLFVTLHSPNFAQKEQVSDFTGYTSFSEKNLFDSVCEPHCGDGTPTLIAYVTPVEFPEYPAGFIEALETFSFAPWYGSSHFKFLRLANEQEMLQLSVLHHIKSINYVAGIAFKSNFSDVARSLWTNSSQSAATATAVKLNYASVHFDLSYEIRMVKYIPSELSSFGAFSVDDSNVNYYKPFMGLQLAVTRAFLHYAHNGTFRDPFQLDVKPFPSPPHVRYYVTTSNYTYQFVTISLVLGFVFVVFSLIKSPCTEQETLFKPYLHRTGFPRWAYWLCWILNDSVVQLIAVGLQITQLFVSFDNIGSLVKHGSPIIWSLFLLLYAVSAISFLTFLASFFNRGVLGTYVGATIWLLSFYFADLFLPSYVLAVSSYTKMAMCLVPNAALIWGITLMAANPGGINYSNIFNRLDEDGISLLEIMIMLSVDIPLYFMLTFMLDRTHHGLILKPWYALWKRLFQKHVRHTKEFCGAAAATENVHTEINVASSSSDTQLSPDHSPEFYVPFAKEDTIIETMGLSKVYYNKAVGVYKVNLKVEVNKCTAIVGHHSAGKSTLINLLCGEEKATSGTIKVCGYDVCKNKQKVQALISVCTSENVLCTDMTVLEHLLFIGKLKGLNHQEARHQAGEFMRKLGLAKKEHKYPEQLFEFEKRKLCVSMAFMGNSKIVIIDEPTKSIADEEFCKTIWDFILSFNGRKTIIVATFSMDEGYHLGDAVVILSNGRVVAAGTAGHLERLFGTGYQLKLKLEEGADPNKIRELIQYHASTSTEAEPKIAQVLRSLSAVSTDLFEEKGAKSSPEITKPAGKEDDISTGTSIYFDAESTVSGAQHIEETAEELLKLPVPPTEQNSKASSRTLVSRISQMTCDMEILLPKGEVASFPNIFELLENQNVQKLLGILKWRLNLYEIDRAYRDTNEYIGFNSRDAQEMLSETHAALADNLLEAQHPERVKGLFCLGLYRLKALIIKRMQWILNIKMQYLVQLLTPILLLILTIQGTNSLFHNQLEKSAHQIRLRNFPKQTVLIRNVSDAHNFTAKYEGLVRRELPNGRVNITQVDNFRSHIAEQRDPIGTLAGHLIVGLQVEDATLTAMFSPLAFHAGPISLQLLLNTYLKLIFPRDDVRMSAISHPIQNRSQEALKFYSPYDALAEGDDEILSFAVILGFGMFVLCSGFTLQPVAERVWHIKRLQLNTSTSQSSYWLAYFLSDWPFTILVAGLLLIVLMYVPDHPAFSDLEFAKHFLGAYILSSLSSLLLSYNLSFLFRNANTCFYGMLSINQVFGLFAFIWAITIQIGWPVTLIVRLILGIFLQPFCVPAAFYSLIQLAIKNNKCALLSSLVKNAICDDSFMKAYNLSVHNLRAGNKMFDLSCCPTNSQKPRPYLLLDPWIPESKFAVACICLVFHTIALTLLLIHQQSGTIGKFIKRKLHQRKLRHSLTTPEPELIPGTHPSIQTERNKMKNLLESKDKLDRQDCFIINKTSVTVLRGRPVLGEIQLICPPGQITTIFGPLGAGKTVLMHILAKFRKCHDGAVKLNEADLLFGTDHEVAAGLKQIGYCPESVTRAFTKLTARQLLRLMGRLRGIPENVLGLHVNKWIRLFGFNRGNEPFRYYSESMKRKVFIMLTLIGEQQVLLFDNPTKNLDPASKFQFWTIVNHLAVKERRTVVISTSRVEDLDKHGATKLIMLVNGTLQFVSTPEGMMNEMGRGYTILINLKPNPNAGFDTYIKLKEKLEKDLTRSILLEEGKELLRYSIPHRRLIPWSDLFRKLEAIKSEFESVIGSYSARETLLEDILHIASLKQKPSHRILSTMDEFCVQFC